jgi:hypothetical protein
MQTNGKQTEFDAKLKGFQDRADRCRLQLENFKLFGASTNNVGIDKQKQPLGDNLPSANNC